MRILIIGAGIGGLTAALELHSAGIDVNVFETVSELQDSGVGINLQPNAVKLLADLGLLEALMEVSVQPKQTSYYSDDGRYIHAESRGASCGYKFPQLAIHRAKLLNILKKAVQERIGTKKLYFGHKFIDYEEKQGKVFARFQLQHLESKVYEGDVLIGADGIGSRLRKILHPTEKGFHTSGYKMWRGLTVMQSPLDGETILVCGNT